MSPPVEHTNVIKLPFPPPHPDFIDDAFSSAKFSFLVGGAWGLQSSMMRHRATAVLIDTLVHPGVPANIFKNAFGFAAASVGVSAVTHLSKALRGVDDSVNFGIATGCLGAAVGASRRSAKKAILFSGALFLAGGLSDYMLRQMMANPGSKDQLHSTVDYVRFNKKE